MAGPTIYYSNAPTQAVIGASTDTKPTTLPLGSVFWESDTGHKYIFAGGTTWFQDQSSGGGSPTGAAGGDLGGTYPNPIVLSLAHVTGPLALSANGAASAPPFALTGTWFTGGSGTTTKPAVLVEPSGTLSTGWNTAGTGLGVNAPSGFGGSLLDLQLNGVSTFAVVAGVNPGPTVFAPGLFSGFGVIGLGTAAPSASNYTLAGDGSGNTLLNVPTGGNIFLRVNNVSVAQIGGSAIIANQIVVTVASATGQSGFRLPHGTAPTSPQNGDMWTTTSGLFVQINGVTQTVPGGAASANVVFAGPASGSSAAPTFRSLVTADLPTVLPTLTGTVLAPSMALGGALTSGVIFQIPIAPTASANYGLVSIGGGAWDGVTSGFFAGNSLGTHLAFNTVTGFGGRIIDARQAGVRQFAIGLGTVASATSAVLNGIDIAPFTYTISGSSAITTATGFNAVTIGVPTYTAASAVAISVGATLAIAGAPAVAGSATLATPLAVWVLGGTTRLDGNLMLSSDVTVQRLGAHSIQLGAAASSSPVSYTLTGGESALAGTATNTAGGSLTIASGLGTGTGAVSSIVFQTPTVGTTGSAAQALATRLTLSSASATFVPQLIGPLGTSTTPTYAFTGNSNTGLYLSSTATIRLTLSGTDTLEFDINGVQVTSTAGFRWSSGVSGASSDLWLLRLNSASLQIGKAASATPVANILTIGESSRSGVDSNVAGANGTLQSGLGTGIGALASLSLASPIAAASGTTAQTYATGLKILVGTAVLTNYIVANLPAAAAATAGATAFVTDGSTTVILGLGQAVTGGGANKVPVYSDGTNWIIG